MSALCIVNGREDIKCVPFIYEFYDLYFWYRLFIFHYKRVFCCCINNNILGLTFIFVNAQEIFVNWLSLMINVWTNKCIIRIILFVNSNNSFYKLCYMNKTISHYNFAIVDCFICRINTLSIDNSELNFVVVIKFVGSRGTIGAVSYSYLRSDKSHVRISTSSHVSY